MLMTGMDKESPILILGSRGLVGQAITDQLRLNQYSNLLTPPRSELDLTNKNKVEDFFNQFKPKYVFLAAAKVGGIYANKTYPVEFLMENLKIQMNVFELAAKYNVKKLLFTGSSCIYPKESLIPIKEEYLLTGPLEKTNEAYALAKICGLKMAQYYQSQYDHNFFSVMPTNLYGINDNFHEKNSHVIPGLIARMVNAHKNNDSEFKIWGTGRPKREFLYADDLAKACIMLMNHDKKLPTLINIGHGHEISISKLAKKIADIIGLKASLVFDDNYPDGTMSKLIDSSFINSLGWRPTVSLDDGLKIVIDHYLTSISSPLKA